MKRFIACMFFLSLVVRIFATGQESDIIYISGERWQLLSKPIIANLTLYHHLKNALPKERSWSTANWDGYTAYWSVNDESLRLDSIIVVLFNKETKKNYTSCLSLAKMREVFKDYCKQNTIVATWFTGDIRAGKGRILYYEHTWFERNHEYEQVFTIKQGRVINQQTYHNRVVVDGFSLATIRSQEDLKTKLPLNLKSYPELAEAKSVIFTVNEICLDSLGNLVDCNVKAFVWFSGEKKQKEVERLAKEMKEMLTIIHPWKTLFINGEYMPSDKRGFTFRYILDS